MILTLRINFNWPYVLFSFILYAGLVRENGMGLLELGCSCRWVLWGKKKRKKFNSVGTRPHVCSCHLPTGKSPLVVNLLFFLDVVLWSP
jgi:hypothetical protein